MNLAEVNIWLDLWAQEGVDRWCEGHGKVAHLGAEFVHAIEKVPPRHILLSEFSVVYGESIFRRRPCHHPPSKRASLLLHVFLSSCVPIRSDHGEPIYQLLCVKSQVMNPEKLSNVRCQSCVYK